MKIPIPYRIYISWMNKKFNSMEIEVKKFRTYLSFYFRIPKPFTNRVLIEMKDLKLIEFHSIRWVRILQLPD